MSLSEKIWTLKLTLIGNKAVGKTSLRRTFLGEKFETNYKSTIGADFSFKQVILENGDIVNTAIWDLAGQKTYQNIHPQYYKSAAGCIIVYDVSDPGSIDSVEGWVSRFIEFHGSIISPIMILGNKIDLFKHAESKAIVKEQKKLISRLEIIYPNQLFLSMITSAKTGVNVDSGFNNLVVAVMKNIDIASLERVSQPIDDINVALSAAYVITFHDIYGPQIIAKSPLPEKPFLDEEFSSAIKISSVIDFEDVAEHTHLSGTFPWLAPLGHFSYIAFTIDNPDIGKNKGLYIIGVVEHERIRESTSKHVPIITGYLHQAMNDFSYLLVNKDDNFITQQMDTTKVPKNEEISNILYQLRKNIFDLIKFELV